MRNTRKQGWGQGACTYMSAQVSQRPEKREPAPPLSRRERMKIAQGETLGNQPAHKPAAP